MIGNIHIEDVMGHYSLLTRASVSGKTLKCRCPFHYDEFKSMKISTRLNTYECELCGEKGDVFDFIQNIEGCKRKTAIKIITDFYKTGMIYSKSVYPKGKALEPDVQSLLEGAPEHITNRMIVESLDPYVHTDDFIVGAYNDFGVGIVPEVFPSQFADLKGKLIFPIYSSKKNILGYIHTSDSVRKKYKCWPMDILTYSFYGLAQAFDSIERSGFAYLVKECEDVVIMHAAGFTNTIGYMESCLLFTRVQTLMQMTNRAVLFNNEDIRSQVYCTKNTARLSHERIATTHINLPENICLKDLYHRLGLKKFTYFIRQSTRLSRLEELRKHLVFRLDGVLFDTENAKTVTERAELRSKAMPLQNELSKVLSIMGEYSVDYMLEE